MKCEKINLEYPPNCIKYTLSQKDNDGTECFFYKIFSLDLLLDGRDYVTQEVNEMRRKIRDKIKHYEETRVR